MSPYVGLSDYASIFIHKCLLIEKAPTTRGSLTCIVLGLSINDKGLEQKSIFIFNVILSRPFWDLNLLSKGGLEPVLGAGRLCRSLYSVYNHLSKRMVGNIPLQLLQNLLHIAVFCIHICIVWSCQRVVFVDCCTTMRKSRYFWYTSDRTRPINIICPSRKFSTNHTHFKSSSVMITKKSKLTMIL